jgi:hypothetical protein
VERDCVVILAPATDIHAITVARHIERDWPRHSVFVIDTALFPESLCLSLRPGGWTLTSEDWAIDSDRVSGVWHRRPAPPLPSATIVDEATRRFAKQESGLAIDCISIEGLYRVVNPIDRHFLANRKPYQLRVAQECGLNVPPYDITNDPARVAQLLHHDGDDAFIFKTLGPAAHVIAETRHLRAEHLADVDAMKLAPVIYQRKITRCRDYRVVAVGDELFAHELVMHNDKATMLPDWRLDLTVESKVTSLPEDVTSATLLMMKRLGLWYGAIDFIEDDHGIFWFLEVNPQGQFLFNEIDAQTPISASMAALLASPF